MSANVVTLLGVSLCLFPIAELRVKALGRFALVNTSLSWGRHRGVPLSFWPLLVGIYGLPRILFSFHFGPGEG
jgi:hypothetical protein